MNQGLELIEWRSMDYGNSVGYKVLWLIIWMDSKIRRNRCSSRNGRIYSLKLHYNNRSRCYWIKRMFSQQKIRDVSIKESFEFEREKRVSSIILFTWNLSSDVYVRTPAVKICRSRFLIQDIWNNINKTWNVLWFSSL